MRDPLPSGGIEVLPGDLEALGARWSGCWEPGEVARRLAGVTVPWYVAAGWALDLFRGERSREHHDIEIGVPAGRFPEIRDRFAGYAFDAIGQSRIWESPSAEVLDATWQTWLRDPATGCYLLDVFRERHDGEVWICRRDPAIRRPFAEVIRYTADHVPYMSPEFVLLFKAKHVRPKDQADFDGVLPLLSRAQRDSLAGMLSRVHPGHVWLAAL